MLISLIIYQQKKGKNKVQKKCHCYTVLINGCAKDGLRLEEV